MAGVLKGGGGLYTHRGLLYLHMRLFTNRRGFMPFEVWKNFHRMSELIWKREDTDICSMITGDPDKDNKEYTWDT